MRVAVFRGFPVMAMTRLPTEESEGTANLQKGALGAGVHLATGRVLAAYHQATGRWFVAHPDTGARIEGVEIPAWETVLDLAVRAATATRLGYAGVDVVFDAERGPLVLEVNVLPGLGIQNANLAGLRPRLRLVESLPASAEYLLASARVALARDWAAAGWTATLDAVDRQLVEAATVGSAARSRLIAATVPSGSSAGSPSSATTSRTDESPEVAA